MCENQFTKSLWYGPTFLQFLHVPDISESRCFFLSLVIGYDNNTIPYLTVTPTPMVMLFLQKIKFQKNNPIACYSIWNQGSLRKLSLIISLLLSGTRFWMNSRIVLVVNFVESLPQIEWRKVHRFYKIPLLALKIVAFWQQWSLLNGNWT